MVVNNLLVFFSWWVVCNFCCTPSVLFSLALVVSYTMLSRYYCFSSTGTRACLVGWVKVDCEHHNCKGVHGSSSRCTVCGNGRTVASTACIDGVRFISPLVTLCIYHNNCKKRSFRSIANRLSTGYPTIAGKTYDFSCRRVKNRSGNLSPQFY